VVAAGNVLADEKITLYGLEVSKKKVAYGNINPKVSTEIFIRAALVEEDLLPNSRRREEADDNDDDDVRLVVATPRRSSVAATPSSRNPSSDEASLPPQYAFLEHNRKVRQKIETWQTRVRRHDFMDLDQALFNFYNQRIANVSSVHELNRFLREQAAADSGAAPPLNQNSETRPNSQRLFVTETDLTGGALELHYDAGAFPDAVPLGGQPVALSYAYTPGEEQDGVTVKLGFTLAQTISQASVEWAVPGLRESQISELLRALPKALRRELMPFPPKVTEIARELQPTGESLQQDLARFIKQRYGVEIPANAWPADAIPAHLRPRVEVISHDQKSLGTSRDLNQLRQRLEKEVVKVQPAGDDPTWTQATLKWERLYLTAWTIGDVLERITVKESPDLPIYAWPGLAVEANHVSLKLFRSQEAARRASLGGIQRLVALALQKDLAWLHKDLRALAQFGPLLGNFGTMEELCDSAFENLQRHILPSEVFPALTEAHFRAAVEESRSRLPGLAAKLMDHVGTILKVRQEILRRCGAVTAPQTTRPQTLSDLKQLGSAPAPNRHANPWAEELTALLPPNFLQTVQFSQLPHLPRYLKALLIRIERATLNPAKDQERARLLAPYLEMLRKFAAHSPASADSARQREIFRWMVEEYKVSVFAQELGTAFPISPKRLDEQLQRI